MLKATKVPWRPVWVHPIRLSATIAAATFLSLSAITENRGR
jgi:hypothetical protein